MKCPYCGNEMQNGSVIANGPQLRFITEDVKIPDISLMQTGLDLGSKKGAWVVSNAYNCPACMKVIIDMAPKEMAVPVIEASVVEVIENTHIIEDNQVKNEPSKKNNAQKKN